MAQNTNGWEREINGAFSITFTAPKGKTKPRRVSPNHVRELNARLEATARTFFETIDQKTPYAVEGCDFRTRYGYFAVDTANDPAADQEV